MTIRYRRFAATALAAGCMTCLAACGSSSSSSRTTSAGAGTGAAAGARVGFKLTAAQRSCLSKKGVTLPSGSGHGYGGGRFAKGGGSPKGTFPRHRTPPKGAARGFPAGGSAQMRKRFAALKACGVSFGEPRGAGGAVGAGAAPPAG